MEFKRLDKRKGSGAASIRSRYAYLIHLPDIDYFPPVNEKGVRLEGDIVLHEGRTMIPVYLTNPSQEYSYDTPGGDDEKTFLVKFTGTHPGTELEALEFSKNLLEHPFLVLIPGCEKNAPGKLLGQLDNPLIFTSTHKAGRDGDKFTFNFEQRIGSEFIYFSYGGVISLPPAPDGPPSDPGHSGFDPTKWARIDASNIDAHIAAWRAKLIQEPEDPTEEETASAPNSRLEDGWRTINNTAPLSIVLGNDPAGSFHLTGAGDIAGFTTKMGKYMWPGRGMILYTEHAVTLKHQPQEPTTNAKYFTFAEDFTTKPDGWYILKEKASFIEVVELGGGSAEFPAANPGDVLVKGVEDWEASGRLTNVEAATDMLMDELSEEIADRTAAVNLLQFQIDVEEGRNNTQDAQIAGNTAAIALKLDKPTAPNNVPARVINADGSTSDKGEFQLSEQIEITTSQTAQASWRGKELWVLGNCTLTIPDPATLPAFWSIDVYVWVNCTLTLAITSPAAWVNGTPGTVAQKSVCRIVRRGSTNQFIILGL